ncbi:24581_t:CDS:2 [Dentiscutata erythropus]|uniref:24581_t:CDS:1 n=1 Tax=Dentiscutata erythropus TaxID=1348616 RepID=A0A9N8WEX4_9GLOM|nr:24581_t:CDS:2 [Dentiscutata erythropus]
MSKRKKVETEEQALLVWVNCALEANITISGFMLTAQAQKFAELFQITNFKASEGNLRISSRSSYDLKDLPSSASKFAEEDVEALNATFKSASNESEVIPDVEGLLSDTKQMTRFDDPELSIPGCIAFRKFF